MTASIVAALAATLTTATLVTWRTTKTARNTRRRGYVKAQLARAVEHTLPTGVDHEYAELLERATPEPPYDWARYQLSDESAGLLRELLAEETA